MTAAVTADQASPSGLRPAWWPMISATADCPIRYAASATKAAPIRRKPLRRLASPTPDSSHSTTALAPISISESSPKPASATDRDPTAATASTPTPTTFQPIVAHSSVRPRRSKTTLATASACDSPLVVDLRKFFRRLERAAILRSTTSAERR
jgi:hypothetical protein